MLKAMIAMAVALLLAVSAAFWQYDRAQGYKDKAETATIALAASQARLSNLQRDLRTVRSNYATSNQRLDAILRGSQPTATPVPVYNELCKRGNCVKLDPLQAPAD